MAVYHIYHNQFPVCKGVTRGVDHTQALCRAVHDASKTLADDGHLTVWMRPSHVTERILTFKPHRDTHITYDTCAILIDFLDRYDTNTVCFRTDLRSWPGFPDCAELRSVHPMLNTLLESQSSPDNVTPKQAMWNRIKAEYTPSDHPSHIACKTPDGNKPPPAIRAAIESHNRLIMSSIF
jgi:hypothetical protein